jgi:hypothetical protein
MRLLVFDLPPPSNEDITNIVLSLRQTITRQSTPLARIVSEAHEQRTHFSCAHRLYHSMACSWLLEIAIISPQEHAKRLPPRPDRIRRVVRRRLANPKTRPVLLLPS